MTDRAPGRPSRTGERATERVELRLTLSELRELHELATLNGTDMSGLLRQGIDEIRRQCEEDELPATIDGARLLKIISPGRKDGLP